MNGDSRIPFDDGSSLEIQYIKNGAKYTFYDEKGTRVFSTESKHPESITERSQIGIEIKKHLNPDNRLTKQALAEDFENIRKLLIRTLAIQVEQKAQQAHEAQIRAESEKKKQMRSAELFLQLCPNPLLWIANQVGWLTAGEKLNIMLAFTAYSSQIILRNPVSVICLGEGASGKSHIQNTSLGLIPKEYVLYEKSITEAAMFRRAQTDEYFYDGKIVNYGDMGGVNSQSEVANAKDMLKELQSDGYLSKPLTIPSDDGWIVQDLILKGFPALTYTSVPGHQFDDQELSRSIFITPRLDNKEVYQKWHMMVTSGGRTKTKIKKVQQQLRQVPFMLKSIRGKYDDVTIMNPYHSIINDLLGRSEYYKRDRDKYLTILRTVTAINGVNRDIHEFYGEKYLFTTFDDVQLFQSMINPYSGSIGENLTPGASEVMQTLIDNIEEWSEQKRLTREYQFNINEFVDLSKTKLHRRSVQKYIKELTQSGAIKFVGKHGPQYQYSIALPYMHQAKNTKLEWSDEDRDLISYELCDEAVDIIDSDTPTPGLTINNPIEGVKIPPWEKYDR